MHSTPCSIYIVPCVVPCVSAADFACDPMLCPFESIQDPSMTSEFLGGCLQISSSERLDLSPVMTVAVKVTQQCPSLSD